MPTIHLLEGPVGAGKSTLAAALSARHDAPRFILDDWMAVLFRPDRPEVDLWPWYLERKQRCIELIWRLGDEALDRGQDVILELGLVRRAAREEFYQRVDAADRQLIIYLLDAPRELRRARVQERNERRGPTFAMPVPDAIFELASDAWEAPDERELAGREVRYYGQSSD